MVQWLVRIHRVVWGPCTLALFLGTGLWFTWKSGFFQVRGIRTWWGQTIGVLLRGEGAEATDTEAADAENMGAEGSETLMTGARAKKQGTRRISQFQSACTALAATIGTGNIVGVATALTVGGPGAIFWMWISSGIGMMTAYAETWLGIRYRYRKDDGNWLCGPMVYMERGLGSSALGKIYAFLVIMASLGMGSMVQANSLSETVRPWGEAIFGGMTRVMEIDGGVTGNIRLPGISGCIGVLVVMAVGLILSGGIHRISRVTERLVPLSAGIYLIFSLGVILSCWQQLPGVFAEIFEDACQPDAAGGGIAGYLIGSSVRYGLSRGVFSNEAGLGSLAILHGAAEDVTPEQQGMWAMFEVFFDTIVICTLTALVILCVTDLRRPPAGYDGAALTAWCFSQRLGILGEMFVSGSMIVFAFATIIAWYYLGAQAVEYLVERCVRGSAADSLSEGKMQNGWKHKVIQRGYLFVYLGAVFAGCIGQLDLVWLISDIWNGLLAFPNLLALWLLAGEVFERKPGTGD